MRTETPSSTPRTDAALREINTGGTGDRVSSEFARTLERENAALRAQNEATELKLDEVSRDFGVMKRRAEAAEADCAAMRIALTAKIQQWDPLDYIQYQFPATIGHLPLIRFFADQGVAAASTDAGTALLDRLKTAEEEAANAAGNAAAAEMGRLDALADNARLRAALESWMRRAPNWTVYQTQMDPKLFCKDVEGLMNASREALTAAPSAGKGGAL